MKKIISIILLILAFIPFIASAQTVPSNNDLLISTINQLIGLINQEIQSLQEQLIQVEANQATSTPVVIATSTPIISPQTVASIPQLPSSTVIIQDPTDTSVVSSIAQPDQIPSPTCTITAHQINNYQALLNWSVTPINDYVGGVLTQDGEHNSFFDFNGSAGITPSFTARMSTLPNEPTLASTTTFTLTVSSNGGTNYCSTTVIPQ